jgi:hypothetical protein
MQIIEADVVNQRSVIASVQMSFLQRLAAVIQALYMYCHLFDEARSRFTAFVDRHIVTLRAMIAADAQLIFRHFHFLLEVSSLYHRFEDVIRAQPFPDRREWLYRYLDSQKGRQILEMVQEEVEPLIVDRMRILEDSCSLMVNKDVHRLMMPSFSVKFRGEDGTCMMVCDGV